LFAFLLTVGTINRMSIALAHDGATGIVKQRMEAMKTLGDYSTLVGDMLKGKTELDITIIGETASVFVQHGEVIPAHFPDTKQSREGLMTAALPAIWTEWEDFNELALQFTADSRSFESFVARLDPSATVSNSTQRSIKRAFLKSIKSCSSCHKRFRVAKK